MNANNQSQQHSLDSSTTTHSSSSSSSIAMKMKLQAALQTKCSSDKMTSKLPSTTTLMANPMKKNVVFQRSNRPKPARIIDETVVPTQPNAQEPEENINVMTAPVEDEIRMNNPKETVCESDNEITLAKKEIDLPQQHEQQPEKDSHSAEASSSKELLTSELMEEKVAEKKDVSEVELEQTDEATSVSTEEQEQEETVCDNVLTLPADQEPESESAVETSEDDVLLFRQTSSEEEDVGTDDTTHGMSLPTSLSSVFSKGEEEEREVQALVEKETKAAALVSKQDVQVLPVPTNTPLSAEAVDTISNDTAPKIVAPVMPEPKHKESTKHGAVTPSISKANTKKSKKQQTPRELAPVQMTPSEEALEEELNQRRDEIVKEIVRLRMQMCLDEMIERAHPKTGPAKRTKKKNTRKATTKKNASKNAATKSKSKPRASTQSKKSFNTKKSKAVKKKTTSKTIVDWVPAEGRTRRSSDRLEALDEIFNLYNIYNMVSELFVHYGCIKAPLSGAKRDSASVVSMSESTYCSVSDLEEEENERPTPANVDRIAALKKLLNQKNHSRRLNPTATFATIQNKMSGMMEMITQSFEENSLRADSF